MGEHRIRSCAVFFCRFYLSGTWTLKNNIPDADVFIDKLQASNPIHRLSFDSSGMTEWDSGLLVFLAATCIPGNRRGVH